MKLFTRANAAALIVATTAMSHIAYAEEPTYAENLASDLDKVEGLVEQVPAVAPHLMQTATMVEYGIVAIAVLYLLFRFLKRNSPNKRGVKGPILVTLLLAAWLALQFKPMWSGKTEEAAPAQPTASTPAAAPVSNEAPAATPAEHPAEAPVTTSTPSTTAPAANGTNPAVPVEVPPAPAPAPAAPADQNPTEPAAM